MQLSSWVRPAATGVAALLLAASASAQVYVPSNTPTVGTCNSYPTNQSETRYQLIVDSSYLPSSPFKVTDVAFAPCNAASPVYSQYEVRMVHTTLTSFSGNNNYNTNIGMCPAVLHSGPLSWTATANTWSPLGTVGNAFGYDGGGRNILVEFRFIRSSGTGTSSHRDGVSPRMWANGAGTYNATTGSFDTAGAKLQLLITRTDVLNASDTVQIGGSAAIALSGAQVAAAYQIAASLSTTPIQLAPNCTLYLTPDALFSASAGGTLPGIFANYAGIVNASGTAGAKLNVPAIPALVGICVYHAAATVAGGNIVGCTNTTSSELVP